MPANRKCIIQSSDSEGPPVSLDASRGGTSRMQPDGDISTDVSSETEVPSPIPKKRKLEAQPVPQVLGK